MFSKEYMAWKRQMMTDAKNCNSPITGQFELTPRCNLDCKMCYVHNQDSNACKDRELSTQQWMRIFDEAYESGMLFAVLTGGECLVRKDFKELYLHLWNKRIIVMVLTNGTLLDDDMLDFFKQYPPEGIQISIYGSSEEGYLRVTGHAGFARAIAAGRRVMEAGIPFRFALTCNSYIAEDYINTIRYLKQEKLPYSMSETMLLPKRDDPDNNDHFLSVEDLVALSSERCKLFGDLTGLTDLPPIGGSETEPVVTGVNCTAGCSYAFVTWEGKMYPCNALIEREGYSLMEMSYAEAWEKTVEAASAVVEPVECKGCAYLKACPKCIAMRATDLHSGHCNPEVCELTRRLVEVGVKKLTDPVVEEDDPIHG